MMWNDDNTTIALDKLKTEIHAPYVRAHYSDLGGIQRRSVYVKLSLDPENTWNMNIYENSRHMTFWLNEDGTLEQSNASYKLFEKRINDSGIPKFEPTGHKKFRKTKYTDVENAIGKINKYLEQYKDNT